MSAVRPAFSLKLETQKLHLRHTFAISRSSEDVAETLLLRWVVDGIEALGESAPISRYGESVSLVAEQLARLPLVDTDPWYFDDLLDLLPMSARGARCALDLALYDLAGKRLGVPLYRLLGLNPHRALETSFTIGLADLEKTIEKTKEAAHFPILKVKVDGERAEQTVEAVRSCFRGTIRLDANEAWTPEIAVRTLAKLERFDIEFCEQPIPAGRPDQLRYVREHSKIPILVDEDCQTACDLARLQGCVDGINIKLVKSGGIREALRIIHAARAMNMKIMIGCMIESSVLATAAAHLTPLCDYADLDGPLLVTDDPFTGVRYEGAFLRLPESPGLGVAPAQTT